MNENNVNKCARICELFEIAETHISSILLSRGKSRQHNAFNVMPCVMFEYKRTILTIDGFGTGLDSKATKFLHENQNAPNKYQFESN